MRFRRHIRRSPIVEPAPVPAEDGTGMPTEAAPRRRRWLRDVAIVAFVAVAGFVVAALWLSPVPMFSEENTVPTLIGQGISDAQQQLTGLGYRVRVEDGVEHPDAPRGKVIAQDPPAGTAAPRSTVVHLTPSAGQLAVPVPDLVGLEMNQARRVLAAAGLKVGSVDSVIDREEDGGVVLGTRPSAGSGRLPGNTVDLIVNGANQ